ncbi:MAG: ribose 5-phosphate isomerase B [Planctomycetes bacterium]|nr:ribose 5-phosphate isomerase B [Planctomycetota bacterium]
MKIAIASDHAGFRLKEALKTFLSEKGHAVADFGTDNETSVDYPDFGVKAAKAVANDTCESGILVCYTGIGMSIIANKVKGIRAALCHNQLTVEMSRRHNNANVLCLGSRIVPEELAKELAGLWLSTPFEGDRHLRRVNKISDYEKT